ncbi:erythromycin esterase family protein [Sinimarinibacterium flocculans]|uniref:erythromycin esterase family protein n=1 Tax=Sinimarinibacterium flocculans TaxID=985250 RepID=UPI003514FC78
MLAAIASPSQAKEESRSLNLDFERVTPAGEAWGWGRWGPRNSNFRFEVDSSTAFSGKRSFRISGTSHGVGSAETVFPVNVAAGRHVRYYGRIKTAIVKEGFAALWWRVLDHDGTYNLSRTATECASGTTEWRECSVAIDVPKTVADIRFGISLKGSGSAWFDLLGIEIDGVKYVEPTLFDPSEMEIRTLMEHAFTFDTHLLDNDDLAALNPLFEGGQIVALGEASHGTLELFELKVRLFKHLTTLGFTVFAIEASMPEAAKLNEYVTGGHGDPKSLLAGLKFWTWNTPELLALIEWIRAYNQSKDRKIEFWGIDCQIAETAIRNVRNFLSRTKPQSLVRFDEASETISGRNPTSETLEALHDIDEVLTLFPSDTSNSRLTWAKQNARIIRQAVYARASMASREECLADNALWVLEQHEPGTKMVLWAHNDHVSRVPITYPRMGSLLSTRSDGYLAVGLTFGTGSYTAVGSRGIATYAAVPAERGSVEWALGQLKSKTVAIDLRPARRGAADLAWLSRELDIRSVGARATADQFVPTNVTRQFDALIYVRDGHPTKPFGLEGPLANDRDDAGAIPYQ